MTERSGYPQDDGVLLAWYPTHKVMEKTQHLGQSVIVLVEWIPGDFDAWAKLHGAYNVVTGEVMDAGLSEEASKALESIVYKGYNGWSRSTDAQFTLSFLDDLDKAGAYDRELVLAYARQTKSEHRIERLKKILDESEASRGAATKASASPFRTSRE